MDWRNRSLVSPGRNIWLPSATLGYRESPSRSSSWRPAFGLLGRLGAKRSRSCARKRDLRPSSGFSSGMETKRAHRASPPVRLVRFRELLCGFDFDAFQGLHNRDGHRATSGDDCVLLCGRYAHWWCKDTGHGPVHSLCARGARCFGAAALPRACVTARRGQTRRRCSGNLASSVRVVHALSALMGVDETPAVSTTVLNRAKAASEGASHVGVPSLSVISCRSSGTGRQGSTPRILAAARCTFHARRAPIDG